MDRAAPAPAAAATPAQTPTPTSPPTPIVAKAWLSACIELSGLKYNIEPNSKSVSGREMYPPPHPTLPVHSPPLCPAAKITRNWVSTRFPNIPAYVCNRNAQHNRGNERRSRLLDSTRLCPDMIPLSDSMSMSMTMSSCSARHGAYTMCAS